MGRVWGGGFKPVDTISIFFPAAARLDFPRLGGGGGWCGAAVKNKAAEEEKCFGPPTTRVDSCADE